MGTEIDFAQEMHRGLNQPAIPSKEHPGRLLPVARVPSPKVKSFDLGAVTTKKNSANFQ